ncbi:MAG: phage holin family protein [Verrucomicrobia bacterium]|nr:phage holin family protein [Verrucomicrobiota bacterium]
MNKEAKTFLQRWLINTVAVLAAGYVVKGIHYENVVALFVASLFLGILNTFVRPLLVILTLPLVLVTLGLFMFIVNAGLLYLVGLLLKPNFEVQSFGAAFWGSLVISLVSIALNALTGTGGARVRVDSRRGSKPEVPNRKDDGNGPVIDV